VDSCGVLGIEVGDGRTRPPETATVITEGDAARGISHAGTVDPGHPALPANVRGIRADQLFGTDIARWSAEAPVTTMPPSLTVDRRYNEDLVTREEHDLSDVAAQREADRRAVDDLLHPDASFRGVGVKDQMGIRVGSCLWRVRPSLCRGGVVYPER
jgi:hypothetical protein